MTLICAGPQDTAQRNHDACKGPGDHEGRLRSFGGECFAPEVQEGQIADHHSFGPLDRHGLSDRHQEERGVPKCHQGPGMPGMLSLKLFSASSNSSSCFLMLPHASSCFLMLPHASSCFLMLPHASSLRKKISETQRIPSTRASSSPRPLARGPTTRIASGRSWPPAPGLPRGVGKGERM